MSLVADSPMHSLSSDDFAAYLDATLDVASSDISLPEEPEYRKKRCKVEKFESVEEHQESTSLEQTMASISEVVCTHTRVGSLKGMCILCGQRLDLESGVALGYIYEDLRLYNGEIVRLRNKEMKNLLRHKKLCLVLDLDHTLLNSTKLRRMTSKEEYLKRQTDSLQDISKGSLFTIKDMDHMMTKLRPFVRTFLKEASEMFEMFIYTMGNRPYALAMAKLLDPQSEYFSARVISRDDGTQKHQKGLDVVLGKESAIVILDDTENAWTEGKDNLILMERYHFFASSCHDSSLSCKSLSELKRDESETDGALATVLKVLKQIHNMFFDDLGDNLADRDVRQVLKTVKKKVLKGCIIVFTRVFRANFPADNHRLWKMAENLGATCSLELDPLVVTHVVSAGAGTTKSCWAVSEGKFLVNPRWIEAANYMWQKQPEKNFPVDVLKGCKIVFCRVYATKFPTENHRIRKMEEDLGATCLLELDPSVVTHVVSTDAGTKESLWAVKEKKFLVLPQWIKATKYMWRKQPEEDFSVN